ncbi:LacI family DNA-binding transcriptional regulator [Streptomyces sp. AS02]|uniref:LacI family DNA-binding transcriptional regulator n=1 Tax=Streptomyces sp. AS02 TaxID=2938946 RepID=UPI0027E4556B|nr:LacI family DNA-binding transcriptional regulator [Streptomyces sp. AS02]
MSRALRGFRRRLREWWRQQARGWGKATVPYNRAERPSAEDHGERGGGPASVTIAYIAESAGVSVPTVSKVLNGRSGVSDETRARVEELIDQYGYRKPPKSRSNLVELVFRELERGRLPTVSSTRSSSSRSTSCPTTCRSWEPRTGEAGRRRPGIWSAWGTGASP